MAKTVEELVQEANAELVRINQDTKAVLTALGARIDEVEQRAVRRPGGPAAAGGGRRIAQALEASAGFKAVLNRETAKAGVTVRSADLLPVRNEITTADFAQPVTRRGGIATDPDRRAWLRDLIPTLPVTNGSVESLREAEWENEAGYQVTEGSVKPESSISLELLEVKLPTIAHWVRASKQVLGDNPALRGLLDRRLRYGLEQKVEEELLMGSGVGNTIGGLLLPANHTPYTGGPTGDTLVDTLRRALGAVEDAGFTPDAIVLNSVDAVELDLLKDNEGRYILGDPGGARSGGVWSTGIYTSPAMEQGTFLAGALGQCTTLWMREDAQVFVSTEDRDNFVKNLVTMLAETRLALSVELPHGIVVGEIA